MGLVKERTGRVCLAVGDGANGKEKCSARIANLDFGCVEDVSMIQNAHVGVGIVGKEGNVLAASRRAHVTPCAGTQAVRASDYALHEFRLLAPLLCIHGRYSLLRITTLCQYSFYKNICYIFPQFLFGFWNVWSGQVWCGVESCSACDMWPIYRQVVYDEVTFTWSASSALIHSCFVDCINDIQYDLHLLATSLHGNLGPRFGQICAARISGTVS